MKTATLPSLRVAPALRSAAEGVLQTGESLSSFVEQAVRASVAQRQMQHEFVARGLAARDVAQASQVYVSAGDVLQQLEVKLQSAEKTASSQKSTL